MTWMSVLLACRWLVPSDSCLGFRCHLFWGMQSLFEQKKSSIFKNQHFSPPWQVLLFACCSIMLSGKKCIEHWVIFTFCLLFNPKIPTKLCKYLIWQECLNVILFFCANTKHSGKRMPSHYMCRQNNQTCSWLQWTLNCLTASTWKV